MGAQIAGYAGKKLAKSNKPKNHQKIGRITALDAASPNFEGMPTSVRLTRNDATFVDAIHTNAKPLYQLGYGTLEPVGHLDFYPNGGLSQPGCDSAVQLASVILPAAIEQMFSPSPTKKLPETGVGLELDRISRLVTCSHLRAIDYFLESLSNKNHCHFNSVPCGSWSEYLDGKCSTENCSRNFNDSKLVTCPPMGLQAYNWAQQMADRRAENGPKVDLFYRKKLYLETNSQSPYCKN